MSAFKIGGSPFLPAPGPSGSKKPERRSGENSSVPSKGGYDTVNFHADRFAVMPRMGGVSGQSVQRLRSAAVESLLKDSAAELDSYFSKAYGFDAQAEREA